MGPGCHLTDYSDRIGLTGITHDCYRMAWMYINHRMGQIPDGHINCLATKINHDSTLAIWRHVIIFHFDYYLLENSRLRPVPRTVKALFYSLFARTGGR